MVEEKQPIVGILMGSRSDQVIMQEAAGFLQELGIPFEQKIISAHRQPKEVHRYAQEVEARGIEIIIAGAGKAAHLAGAVASLTVLPVIGVPLVSGELGGVDALFSTVQMPSGVPVATVGIAEAKNAAILAAEMLGVKYPEIRKKVKKYRESLGKK